MTRVLAFCDYFQEPMGGGAEIVSAEVYRRLAATDDFAVRVLSGVAGPGLAGGAAGPRVDVRARRGIDLSGLVGAQLTVAPAVAFDGARAVRRDRPDVVHASSIHFVGSLIGALVASAARVPLVTTCHVSGLDALPKRTRAVAALYERTVGRFILARSKRIIAVSDSVRDHVVSLGVDPAKIDVIENGVDTGRFQPGERDSTRTVITFVGRLIDNKGPMLLLDAFERLDRADVELQIVGSGPLASAIAERAANDPRISVMGHRSDVAEILAHTDVFVRPSTTEGLSLAILEAMASGCAVVASDIQANADLVCHGVTGLVFPCGDAAALAATLERLVENAPLRCSLGTAARHRAERASWDATSAATGAVLRRAAELGDG